MGNATTWFELALLAPELTSLMFWETTPVSSLALSISSANLRTGILLGQI